MANATAYKRGREAAQAIIHMVNDLVHPRDREPFMDAVRTEVREWFSRRREEPEKAGGAPPAQADASLRSINVALKNGPRRRGRNSARKT